MDTFSSALSILAHWEVLIALLVGSIGGVIIGAIPGVGAPVAIAILLPATFAMEPIVGLTLLWVLHVRWCHSRHTHQHTGYRGQCTDHL